MKKILEKSGKSQGISSEEKSGNPDPTSDTFDAFLSFRVRTRSYWHVFKQRKSFNFEGSLALIKIKTSFAFLNIIEKASLICRIVKLFESIRFDLFSQCIILVCSNSSNVNTFYEFELIRSTDHKCLWEDTTGLEQEYLFKFNTVVWSTWWGKKGFNRVLKFKEKIQLGTY